MEKARDDQGLFESLKDEVMSDMQAPGYVAWRARAEENFKFVTPWGQWTEEEKQFLQDQKRPPTAFNRTNKFIRAICGIEVNNRLQTAYVPTEPDEAGEVKANELMTDASEWMDETSDASRHQSRAFRDTSICGLGCTESSISFDDDPEGLYVEERIYPLEMGWDRDARDSNLADTKRRWRIRQMSLKDARALIPGVTDNNSKFTDDDLDAGWASHLGSQEPSGNPRTQVQKEQRNARSSGNDDTKRKVTIVQVQWWEYETFIRTVDPSTGKAANVSEKQYKEANKLYRDISPNDLPKAKMRRKRFRQALLGNVLIQEGPAPRPHGFTFNFMTGEPDDVEGGFYCLVDLLKDPQKWTNKLFSQLLHMVNSTAKGGILAEADAFEDIRQAQETYARQDAVTVVSKGAISKGKIMAKPGTAITSGVQILTQLAMEAFPDVTGMNMELMGLADREQAGVLEAQRKHAAMTILATLFDSRSYFKKEVGRTKLHFIQEHLSNDRWIRIDREDGPKAKMLTAQDVQGRYDTIVSDAPSAPDTKERAWIALQPILPFFVEQGKLTPELASEIIDFIPGLPSKLAEAFKKAVSEPQPGAQEQAQIATREKNAAIAKDEASAAKSKAGAVLDLAKAAKEDQERKTAEMMDILQKSIGEIYNVRRAQAEDAEIIGPTEQPFARPQVQEDSQELPASPLNGSGGYLQ